MEKKILGAALAGALLLSTGCATIVGDPTQTLTINSSPDGAQVLITDEKGMRTFKGSTPTTVTLQKSDGSYFGGKTYTLEITKEGYNSQIVTVDSNANGWYIGGNLLFGGLIGYLIVDPFNGDMYTLSPKAVNTSLGEQVSVSDSDRQLNIVLLENVPEHEHTQLTRIN